MLNTKLGDLTIGNVIALVLCPWIWLGAAVLMAFFNTSFARRIKFARIKQMKIVRFFQSSLFWFALAILALLFGGDALIFIIIGAMLFVCEFIVGFAQGFVTGLTEKPTPGATAYSAEDFLRNCSSTAAYILR
jgi:hypothetical protein